MKNFDELLDVELGPSAWQLIDQQSVDRFAVATGDRQWIHVDVERARSDSPFGSTVAHGMLTLSLAPGLALELLELQDVGLVLNYGLNRVRFPAPLLVGSRVRMHLMLSAIEEVAKGKRLVIDVRFEDDRQEKPVCVAQLLFQVPA